MRKKVGQLKQWTAERAGKADKTDLGDEFKHLEQVTDEKQGYIEKLSSSFKNYFHHARKRDPLLNLASKMIEGETGLLEGTFYGASMRLCGQAFEKFASLNEETEIKLNEQLFRPMQQIIEEDLKEWQHQKKKLENRRLDYDAKNAKLKGIKGPKDELDYEVNVARSKFEETHQLCADLMVKIVQDNEEQEIDQLLKMARIYQSTFEKSMQLFAQLAIDLEQQKEHRRMKLAEESPLPIISPPVAQILPSLPSPVSVSIAIGLPLITETMPDPISPTKLKPPTFKTGPIIYERKGSIVKREASPPPSNSLPLVLDAQKKAQRIALYNFVPENADELEFKKGDLITVLAVATEDGWAQGEVNGKIGVFPINYTGEFGE